MFEDIYRGKRVLITGNTGFKGSWLTVWLLRLGADVIGFSKDVPTSPSMFEDLGLESKIKHHVADVRDLVAVKAIVGMEKPDFIFHLAAQAIVSVSYENPLDTITTNVVGTMNVLESLRDVDHECCVVLITSDKCYENVEWVWGYKETNKMGGKDIYSGSKGAAELIINSYVESFFSSNTSPVKVAIARAGNVIGGGDWAKDRIVVDCIRAWRVEEIVEIRCPDATRPWQHVLEPLSGYLVLASSLAMSDHLHGEAFNFGPRAEQNHTVLNLLHDLAVDWGFDQPQSAYCVVDEIPFNEAGLLKLNCDKALHYLKWQSTLDYVQTTRYVADWYKFDSAGDNEGIFVKTLEQIAEYEEVAKNQKSAWTK
jgi:CDP-glucose 4,6-dehydratase